MPSRHERLKVSEESSELLIAIRASSTIGPQAETSSSKESTRGFAPEVGSKR